MKERIQTLEKILTFPKQVTSNISYIPMAGKIYFYEFESEGNAPDYTITYLKEKINSIRMYMKQGRKVTAYDLLT